MRYSLLAVLAVLFAGSEASAQIATQSANLTIGGYTVPLVLRAQSSTNVSVFSGRGAFYGPGPQGSTREYVGIVANIREVAGSVKMSMTIREALRVGPGRPFGTQYECAYEGAPPLAGGCTVNLIGVGVLDNNAPASITFTSGMGIVLD